MKKALSRAFILVIGIVLFFTGNAKLNAADKLQIIQSTGGVKNFAANDGYIEKSIAASDLEKGEIIIQLLISNSEETEIVFVLDNSTEIGGIGNLKNTINSNLKTLVTSLHSNSNLKTGVRHMHPYGTITTPAVDGGLISPFTENGSTTNIGLDTYLSNPTGDGQDFIEVLTAAKDSFSTSADNKIIVLITSGMDGTHATEYKNALTQIETTTTIVSIVVNNEAQYIEDIFGTEQASTTTIYENIDDTELNATLNTVLADYIKSLLPTDKNDITIQDLFTQNIVNNFTIEYMGNPTAGIVSGFDSTSNSFLWTLGDLKNNNDALFSYKLTLKGNYDTSLEDVILNTNDRLKIDYKDAADNPQAQIEYIVSPTIKIISTLINPKTGLYDYFIPASIVFCISVLTISIIKRKEVFINI